MSRRDKQKQGMPVVNIGTASLLVILVGLCFAVLSALAVASAKNDYRLSEQMADHTSEYYEASNRANEMLLEDNKLMEGYVVSFSVVINAKQSLVVEAELSGNEINIIKWQVENTSAWENDDYLPVYKIKD